MSSSMPEGGRQARYRGARRVCEQGDSWRMHVCMHELSRLQPCAQRRCSLIRRDP